MSRTQLPETCEVIEFNFNYAANADQTTFLMTFTLNFTPSFVKPLTRQVEQPPAKAKESDVAAGAQDQASALPNFMPSSHASQLIKPPSDKERGREIAENIERLRNFLRDNEPDDKKRQARIQAFDTFSAHVLAGESGYFSKRIDSIYKAGKDSLEWFSATVLDDKVLSKPLRLTHVRNLADGLDVCSEGAASQLMIAAQDLFLATGGITAHAKSFHETLLEQSILEFVQQQHGGSRYYEDNEIHYVNAYRNHLAVDFGVTPRVDKFLPPTLELKRAECREYVQQRVTPTRVIRRMAEGCLEEVRDRFSAFRDKDLSDDDLNDVYGLYHDGSEDEKPFKVSLAERYGSIELNVLLPDHTRLIDNPTLLQRAIAQNLKGLKQLDFKAGAVSGGKDGAQAVKQIDMETFYVKTRGDTKRGLQHDYHPLQIKDLDANSSHAMLKAALTNTHDRAELKKMSPTQVWAMLAANQEPMGWLKQMSHPDVLRYREADPQHEADLIGKVYEKVAQASYGSRQKVFFHVEDDRLASYIEPLVAVDQAKRGENTALHHAVLHGFTQTVEAMSKRTQAINALGAQGESALMLAAVSGQAEMIAPLLKAKSNINALSLDGRTALSLAAEHGHAGVAEVLLNNKANFEFHDLRRNTALMYAAWQGHLKVADQLVKAGASLEGRNEKGWTALMLAAESGHADMVNHLVDAKGNINAENIMQQTALMRAAENGHADVVKVLVNKNANIDAQDTHGCSALIHATKHGHVDVVDALLDAKAQVNAKDKDGWTSLSLAVRNNQSVILDKLLKAKPNVNLQDRAGTTALMHAVECADGNAFGKLLDAGADVELANLDGWTALMVAAENNRPDVARKLIDACADVNRQNGRDGTGETALMIAAAGGHSDVIDLLAREGVNVELDKKNRFGKTALMYAVASGKAEAAAKLLLAGAKLDLKTPSKQTILMLAVHGGYADVVDLLLKEKSHDDGSHKNFVRAGIDQAVKKAWVNAADRDGWTALMYAARTGDVNMVHQLRNAGAVLNKKNNEGHTALQLAGQFGCVEAFEALRRLGA